MPELQQAAGALGVELALVRVRNNDYADAFVRIVATRPDALFVLADTCLIDQMHLAIAPVLLGSGEHLLKRDQLAEVGATGAQSMWRRPAPPMWCSAHFLPSFLRPNHDVRPLSSTDRQGRQRARGC
jgi:hypothetical protein